MILVYTIININVSQSYDPYCRSNFVFFASSFCNLNGASSIIYTFLLAISPARPCLLLAMVRNIAHGSEHSRGVLILIKERLNFELKSCMHDNEGRFIILKANVQEQPFVFVNILSTLQIKPVNSAPSSRTFKMNSRV